VRIGVILPTFRTAPDEAIEMAQQAEALGVDGVFCYDHLWPMGRPDRPALAPFPVLGLLASTTTRVALGTLVARVGLVPPEVLVGEFATLDLLAPGRVVAGLGTGDHLSAAENLAYGIDVAPPDVRRAELRRCAAALHARGITVWLGGRQQVTADMAQELGVAVNVWDAPIEDVADRARHSEVTWAGMVPAPPEAPTPPKAEGVADDASAHGSLQNLLTDLRSAGASWAVFSYPVPLEQLGAEATAGRAE
jgi:Luciferase-like monooxygenase